MCRDAKTLRYVRGVRDSVSKSCPVLSHLYWVYWYFLPDTGRGLGNTVRLACLPCEAPSNPPYKGGPIYFLTPFLRGSPQAGGSYPNRIGGLGG
jgi:hypothetical protein